MSREVANIPPSAWAKVAPEGTFMTDLSVGILETGDTCAHSACGLFCQFPFLDGFAVGPPFRWAMVATLEPPTMLRGSAPMAFSHEKYVSWPWQGCSPSHTGLTMWVCFQKNIPHRTWPMQASEGFQHLPG